MIRRPPRYTLFPYTTIFRYIRTELFGNHSPAVNKVPVKAQLRPSAFIEIEITAGPVGSETSFGSGLPVARESSGVVFLPTVQAINENGEIIGAGDVVAQTAAIFEKAKKMLEKLGLGFDSIVKTLDYITPEALANYRGTGRVRKEFLGPVYPGAAGILMPRLLHPEALIQYDFIASRDQTVAVNPGWDRYEKLTYSPGVRAGKLLFLSGQGSLDPSTERIVHDGDVVAQAEYTYNNIFKVIEAVEANAALHAGAHLVDFVLEAPERVGDALIHKVSLPDDSHFAAHKDRKSVV